MRLVYLATRTAARRAPIYSVARSGLRAPAVLHRCTQRLQCQNYSSFPAGSTAGKKKEYDEGLLKMDIDAAEKHMKEWVGDHASWSHDKLLELVSGSSDQKELKILADDYRGGPYPISKSDRLG